MKVSVCHADTGGCGFYRMIAPATVLKNAGLDITLDYQSQSQRAVYDGDRMVSIKPTGDDVMVIQRPIFPEVLQAIPLIQANGTKVVVELDDDYWSIDPRNGYRKGLAKAGLLDVPDTMLKACRLADMVTVSTPELAKLIPNKNVIVLRNYVPAYYLDIEVDYGENWELTEGKKVVGWTGSTETHVGDLEVMGYSLRRAVRNHDAKFLAIGSHNAGEITGFYDGESLSSDWVELKNYPKAVKSFSIGVVPLRMSRFNQCKSYLKGMEYAALGIPFVASPTEEYKILNKQGVGLIAKEKHDWLKDLNQLLTSDNVELIQAGKAFASENTYERNAWRWAEAWQSIIN